jgi:hypothetical protein
MDITDICIRDIKDITDIGSRDIGGGIIVPNVRDQGRICDEPCGAPRARPDFPLPDLLLPSRIPRRRTAGSGGWIEPNRTGREAVET